INKVVANNQNLTQNELVSKVTEGLKKKYGVEVREEDATNVVGFLVKAKKGVVLSQENAKNALISISSAIQERNTEEHKDEAGDAFIGLERIAEEQNLTALQRLSENRKEFSQAHSLYQRSRDYQEFQRLLKNAKIGLSKLGEAVLFAYFKSQENIDRLADTRQDGARYPENAYEYFYQQLKMALGEPKDFTKEAQLASSAASIFKKALVENRGKENKREEDFVIISSKGSVVSQMDNADLYKISEANKSCVAGDQQACALTSALETKFEERKEKEYEQAKKEGWEEEYSYASMVGAEMAYQSSKDGSIFKWAVGTVAGVTGAYMLGAVVLARNNFADATAELIKQAVNANKASNAAILAEIAKKSAEESKERAEEVADDLVGRGNDARQYSEWLLEQREKLLKGDELKKLLEDYLKSLEALRKTLRENEEAIKSSLSKDKQKEVDEAIANIDRAIGKLERVSGTNH
ncbi:MAG: hypothetical protein D6769_01630, partial [Methanobacteriota archaeon]